MSARTIKKLIDLGYIRKEVNKEDERAYMLYLTDKGKSIIPGIIKIRDEWINILIKNEEEYEINTSIKFLEKVLGNAKLHKKEINENIVCITKY